MARLSKVVMKECRVWILGAGYARLIDPKIDWILERRKGVRERERERERERARERERERERRGVG